MFSYSTKFKVSIFMIFGYQCFNLPLVTIVACISVLPGGKWKMCTQVQPTLILLVS